MADQYKIIHPLKYYRDYLSHNIRPDGRDLLKHRPVLINVNSIETADGSAIVKFGNTTVICGVKAELTQPRAENPQHGFLIPNVELPSLCSSRFRPGPPSEEAQVTSRLVADVVANSGFVDLAQLCIALDKLAWVLYCDIICLDYDGCLVDACLASLGAALRTVKLPHVEYDGDTELTIVSEDRKTPIVVERMPVATTFAIFDDSLLLADPTAEEEGLGTGVITIVTQGESLCSVHKPGGTPVPAERLDTCIEAAKERGTLIASLVDTALQTASK